MRKLFTLVTIAICIIPTLVLAAYDDVTLTTDAVILVGGYTLNVSGSSASVESIVVNSGSFSVTLSSGSSFKISSPTLNQLSSDITSDVTSNICTGSESSITLAYSGGGTVTNVITRSATICTTASSGGGIIRGCTDARALNYSSYAYGTQLSTCQYATSSTPATATSTPTTTPALTASFPRTLYFGLSGTDVLLLQTLLKTWGYYTYPEITGYFGNVTKVAVVAFQKANGIEPVGVMGPITRAKIIVLTSSTSSIISASTTTATPTTFTRDLQLNSTGEDVRTLQKYLNTHGAVVVPTGAGSVGNETTYFGFATQAALIKFQSANGIVPAVGYFGPKTRGFINRN